jgi:hypothetical protein
MSKDKIDESKQYRIYPKGGWHFRTEDCIWAKSSDYVTLPYSEIKKIKPRYSFKRYQPCGCVFGRKSKLL